MGNVVVLAVVVWSGPRLDPGRSDSECRARGARVRENLTDRDPDGYNQAELKLPAGTSDMSGKKK